MDALRAAEDTMAAWKIRREQLRQPEFGGELGFEHCSGMLRAMQAGGFSYGKLCRWLGWIQAACVANGRSTLEEMKNLNRSHAG